MGDGGVMSDEGRSGEPRQKRLARGTVPRLVARGGEAASGVAAASGAAAASSAAAAAAASDEPAGSIEEAVERLLEAVEVADAVAEWTQGGG